MNAKEHEINIWVINKNMVISKTRMVFFKHREVASSTSSSAPMPEGGLTNQMLYDKLFHIENFVTQELCEIYVEIIYLKCNQN